MRDSRVAAWAIRAKSNFLDGIGGEQAKPVERHSHHVAVVAENREGVGGHCARRDVHRGGVSSPAILYMLGIISSRPCDAVKVVPRRRLAARRAARRPRRPRSASRSPRDRAPDVLACPRRTTGRDHSPIGEGGNRIDGDNFVYFMRNISGGLVAIVTFFFMHSTPVSDIHLSNLLLLLCNSMSAYQTA